MPKDGATAKINPQDLYDRLADVQNLAMKINGYRTSVAKYLRSLNLVVRPDARVLDAGCGTGIVSLALQEAGYRPNRIEAIDLSFKSLSVARAEFAGRRRLSNRTDVIQSNVLEMPFRDESFDLALVCGVLEYVSIEDGLRESARVLKKGAPLVLLPVKPSIVGSMLELLYNFKIHPLHSVRETASKYFNIVGNHEFPITEPIGWSKTIFLLEKK